jgi:23S rRNA pseudouridine1911/1915/1917 synthase
MNLPIKNPLPLLIVNSLEEGIRLDCWLSKNLNDLSRNYLQNLIEEGLVLVNGHVQRKRYLVASGDRIQVTLQSVNQPYLIAQDLPLDIIFEDEYLLVINKPAGMIVHPGAGCNQGTVANAIAYRLQLKNELNAEDSLRPGIVHRLDKDTSGVLVTAKSAYVHMKLAEAFSTRQVNKLYSLICCKNKPDELIEAPIDRDPAHRQRMRAGIAGRPSTTLFEVMKSTTDNWPLHLVQAKLITGRTHQIRVHLKLANCPILGDGVYGWDSWNEHFDVKRQFLHAQELCLSHPISGHEMKWKAPLPQDMDSFIHQHHFF